MTRLDGIAGPLPPAAAAAAALVGFAVRVVVVRLMSVPPLSRPLPLVASIPFSSRLSSSSSTSSALVAPRPLSLAAVRSAISEQKRSAFSSLLVCLLHCSHSDTTPAVLSHHQCDDAAQRETMLLPLSLPLLRWQQPSPSSPRGRRRVGLRPLPPFHPPVCSRRCVSACRPLSLLHRCPPIPHPSTFVCLLHVWAGTVADPRLPAPHRAPPPVSAFRRHPPPRWTSWMRCSARHR